MSTVYSIGEALIDFIPGERGVRLEQVETFKRVVGGAPANCAAAVRRLGGKSAFIGKLGDDAFGRLIVDKLEEFGVDTSKILLTDRANTALAFVSLRADGNRDFIFYRNPSADMLLEETEIGGDWFKKGDILHFCSVDLIEAPVKYAHIKAISEMKKAGGYISFDPNVRLPLWKDHRLCKSTILEFLRYADIVKVSDEETEFIFGTSDERKCVGFCFEKGAKAVFITKGPRGGAVYTPAFCAACGPFEVEVADTTGAGDTFSGAVLYNLQKAGGLEEFTEEGNLKRVLYFANVAGALATTKKGAFDALPSLEEVEKHLLLL